MLEYDRMDISEGTESIKQMHKKNAISAIIGILKILVLSISHIFAMGVMI